MKEVFDRAFCLFLEYRLCKLVAYSDDIETEGFWCDGVKLETVLDHQACFTAHFGKSGQVKYNLFLRFGNISSELYASGADLKACVPDVDQVQFLSVDVPHRRIVLDLN